MNNPSDPNLGNRNEPLNDLDDPPNPASSTDKMTSWDQIFKLADQAAPRVGNLKIDASSDLYCEFQKMLPEICVESLFVCRGTERLQVPIGAPVSHQFPIRKTISTHRQTGEIHETET